jgi:DNA primase
MKTTDLNVILNNIKSKISLSETIGRDVKLVRKGREFVGNCPFHSEKTGSFFVNDEKGKYYCFGCGAHGDVFTYVMQSKGLTFRQALEQLAHNSGVKLPAYSATARQNDDRYKNIMDECAKFFTKHLLMEKEVLEYCDKRGLNQEIIKQFRIGFCPKNISSLAEKIGVPAIKKTGITKFINRLIFPIIDPRGAIIAFGARTLQKDMQPKYINSQESETFQKRETLYGYNIACKNVSSNNPYIVVEGYMDAIMMHKFGFNTAVASMGTAFSSEHLLKLWRYCSEPIICFDGDEAGYNAMQRAAHLALEYIQPGKTLRFCKIPNDLDPDSYVREKSAESMNALLKNSIYLVDFLWELFVSAYNLIDRKTPEHIAHWKKETLEKLSVINNTELRDLYISDIKNRMWLLIKGKKTYTKITGSLSVNRANNSLLREAILLYTIVKFKDILCEVYEQLSRIVFSNSFFSNVKDCLLNGTKLDENDVDKLKQIAGQYCTFKQEDALNFWSDVFENHVSKQEYSRDLELTKEDLKAEFKSDAWERLKALKGNLLRK